MNMNAQGDCRGGVPTRMLSLQEDDLLTGDALVIVDTAGGAARKRAVFHCAAIHIGLLAALKLRPSCSVSLALIGVYAGDVATFDRLVHGVAGNTIWDGLAAVT
mmetsp:Transcript_7102/g.13955  ORF Transcript_7102/g.13955 Transcript_7102/m.13955 type:complete len:104 (-) Transcript_7102:818-1129(-)